MKKLTMTRVLTPLAALAFTLGAQATAVSTDGFESYNAETSVTNQTGWSFTTGPDGAADASLVKAYGEAATPTYLPDGTTAGNNFLKLSTEDGILFRSMDGDAGDSVDLYQGLYVDTDVQFTLTDKSDRPAATSDDKFIIWLEADEEANTTNLCVWAREYKVEAGTGIAANSNKVYKLEYKPNGTDVEAIAPGSWHRLTVKAIAQTFTMQKPIPGFQVYLDNKLLTSGQTIVPDDQYQTFYGEVENSTLGGLIDGQLKFFPAMADSLTALTKVGFSGEGAIDNLVVTRDVPAFEDPTTLTFTWDSTVVSSIDIDDLGLSLTTSGSTISVRPGQTFGLSLNFAEGHSTSTDTVSTRSTSGNASVDGLSVTADAFGAATIVITTTAKDTVDVTFKWSALDTAMGERSDEYTAITFTYGDTTVNANIERKKSQLIEGLKVGTNVTVTVTYSTGDWETSLATENAELAIVGTTVTINSRPDSGAAEVVISAAHPATPVARVNGVDYPTFAAALEAAQVASPATITLSDAITLDAAAVIADGNNITIDLAGQTLTGAADAAVFSNAGTLTITNSTVTVGAVIAGSNGSAVTNTTGTLNLQAGKFAGAIAGGTINVSGGSYSADIADAICTPGYALDNVGLELGYPYELSLISYTITYMYGDAELNDITPATYTVRDTVTLTNEVDLGVFGVAFDAWTNATGTVTGWAAGAMTGNQTFYAKVAAIVPSGETVKPGEQSETTYDTAEAATNALDNVTVAATSDVATALGGDTTDYLAKFEKKVVPAAEAGKYVVEIALKAEAAAELADEASTNVAVAVAAKLPDVAASAAGTKTEVIVTGVVPGFYYSISYGTAVNAINNEGDRVLAPASGSITLETPAKQLNVTSGFYRVNVNVAPKAN